MFVHRAGCILRDSLLSCAIRFPMLQPRWTDESWNVLVDATRGGAGVGEDGGWKGRGVRGTPRTVDSALFCVTHGSLLHIASTSCDPNVSFGLHAARH